MKKQRGKMIIEIRIFRIILLLLANFLSNTIQQQSSGDFSAGFEIQPRKLGFYNNLDLTFNKPAEEMQRKENRNFFQTKPECNLKPQEAPPKIGLRSFFKEAPHEFNPHSFIQSPLFTKIAHSFSGHQQQQSKQIHSSRYLEERPITPFQVESRLFQSKDQEQPEKKNQQKHHRCGGKMGFCSKTKCAKHDLNCKHAARHLCRRFCGRRHVHRHHYPINHPSIEEGEGEEVIYGTPNINHKLIYKGKNSGDDEENIDADWKLYPNMKQIIYEQRRRGGEKGNGEMVGEREYYYEPAEFSSNQEIIEGKNYPRNKMMMRKPIRIIHSKNQRQRNWPGGKVIYEIQEEGTGRRVHPTPGFDKMVYTQRGGDSRLVPEETSKVSRYEVREHSDKPGRRRENLDKPGGSRGSVEIQGEGGGREVISTPGFGKMVYTQREGDSRLVPEGTSKVSRYEIREHSDKPGGSRGSVEIQGEGAGRGVIPTPGFSKMVYTQSGGDSALVPGGTSEVSRYEIRENPDKPEGSVEIQGEGGREVIPTSEFGRTIHTQRGGDSTVIPEGTSEVSRYKITKNPDKPGGSVEIQEGGGRGVIPTSEFGRTIHTQRGGDSPRTSKVTRYEIRENIPRGPEGREIVEIQEGERRTPGFGRIIHTQRTQEGGGTTLIPDIGKPESRESVEIQGGERRVIPTSEFGRTIHTQRTQEGGGTTLIPDIGKPESRGSVEIQGGERRVIPTSEFGRTIHTQRTQGGRDSTLTQEIGKPESREIVEIQEVGKTRVPTPGFGRIIHTQRTPTHEIRENNPRGSSKIVKIVNRQESPINQQISTSTKQYHPEGRHQVEMKEIVQEIPETPEAGFSSKTVKLHTQEVPMRTQEIKETVEYNRPIEMPETSSSSTTSSSSSPSSGKVTTKYVIKETSSQKIPEPIGFKVVPETSEISHGGGFIPSSSKTIHIKEGGGGGGMIEGEGGTREIQKIIQKVEPVEVPLHTTSTKVSRYEIRGGEGGGTDIDVNGFNPKFKLKMIKKPLKIGVSSESRPTTNFGTKVLKNEPTAVGFGSKMINLVGYKPSGVKLTGSQTKPSQKIIKVNLIRNNKPKPSSTGTTDTTGNYFGVFGNVPSFSTILQKPVVEKVITTVTSPFKTIGNHPTVKKTLNFFKKVPETKLKLNVDPGYVRINKKINPLNLGMRRNSKVSIVSRGGRGRGGPERNSGKVLQNVDVEVEDEPEIKENVGKSGSLIQKMYLKFKPGYTGKEMTINNQKLGEGGGGGGGRRGVSLILKGGRKGGKNPEFGGEERTVTYTTTRQELEPKIPRGGRGGSSIQKVILKGGGRTGGKLVLNPETGGEERTVTYTTTQEELEPKIPRGGRGGSTIQKVILKGGKRYRLNPELDGEGRTVTYTTTEQELEPTIQMVETGRGGRGGGGRKGGKLLLSPEFGGHQRTVTTVTTHRFKPGQRGGGRGGRGGGLGLELGRVGEGLGLELGSKGKGLGSRKMTYKFNLPSYRTTIYKSGQLKVPSSSVYQTKEIKNLPSGKSGQSSSWYYTDVLQPKTGLIEDNLSGTKKGSTNTYSYSLGGNLLPKTWTMKQSSRTKTIPQNIYLKGKASKRIEGTTNLPSLGSSISLGSSQLSGEISPSIFVQPQGSSSSGGSKIKVITKESTSKSTTVKERQKEEEKHKLLADDVEDESDESVKKGTTEDGDEDLIVKPRMGEIITGEIGDGGNVQVYTKTFTQPLTYTTINEGTDDESTLSSKLDDEEPLNDQQDQSESRLFEIKGRGGTFSFNGMTPTNILGLDLGTVGRGVLENVGRTIIGGGNTGNEGGRGGGIFGKTSLQWPSLGISGGINNGNGGGIFGIGTRMLVNDEEEEEKGEDSVKTKPKKKLLSDEVSYNEGRGISNLGYKLNGLASNILGGIQNGRNGGNGQLFSQLGSFFNNLQQARRSNGRRRRPFNLFGGDSSLFGNNGRTTGQRDRYNRPFGWGWGYPNKNYNGGRVPGVNGGISVQGQNGGVKITGTDGGRAAVPEVNGGISVQGQNGGVRITGRDGGRTAVPGVNGGIRVPEINGGVGVTAGTNGGYEVPGINGGIGGVSTGRNWGIRAPGINGGVGVSTGGIGVPGINGGIGVSKGRNWGIGVPGINGGNGVSTGRNWGIRAPGINGKVGVTSGTNGGYGIPGINEGIGVSKGRNWGIGVPGINGGIGVSTGTNGGYGVPGINGGVGVTAGTNGGYEVPGINRGVTAGTNVGIGVPEINGGVGVTTGTNGGYGVPGINGGVGVTTETNGGIGVPTVNGAIGQTGVNVNVGVTHGGTNGRVVGENGGLGLSGINGEVPSVNGKLGTSGGNGILGMARAVKAELLTPGVNGNVPTATGTGTSGGIGVPNVNVNVNGGLAVPGIGNGKIGQTGIENGNLGVNGDLGINAGVKGAEVGLESGIRVPNIKAGLAVPGINGKIGQTGIGNRNLGINGNIGTNVGVNGGTGVGLQSGIKVPSINGGIAVPSANGAIGLTGINGAIKTPGGINGKVGITTGTNGGVKVGVNGGTA